MYNFDVMENGKFILRRQFDVSGRRGCPNCLLCSRNPRIVNVLLQRMDGKVTFTHIQFCCCRIKAYKETIVLHTDETFVNSLGISSVNSSRTLQT